MYKIQPLATFFTNGCYFIVKIGGKVKILVKSKNFRKNILLIKNKVVTSLHKTKTKNNMYKLKAIFNNAKDAITWLNFLIFEEGAKDWLNSPVDFSFQNGKSEVMYELDIVGCEPNEAIRENNETLKEMGLEIPEWFY